MRDITQALADMAELSSPGELTSENDIQKALTVANKHLVAATEAASAPPTTASTRKAADACLVARRLLQTLPPAEALKVMPVKVVKAFITLAAASMQLLGRPGALVNGQPSEPLNDLLLVRLCTAPPSSTCRLAPAGT